MLNSAESEISERPGKTVSRPCTSRHGVSPYDPAAHTGSELGMERDGSKQHGGYLADADFNTEQAAPTATSPVAVAAIPRTCPAIAEFQRVVGLGRVTATGQVAPGDVTHRLLMNPSLPVPMNAAIGGSVGRGAANAPADVRLVQQRLQELGFLSSSAYLAERPDASVVNAIAVAALTRTIAAIEQFQSSVVGVPPDGRIKCRGPVGRPTRLAQADAESVRPCSATPRARRPRSAVASGTALDTLNRYPDIASSYGLSQQDRTSLSQVAANTNAHYEAIFRLVPAPGMTEANLQTAIANYVSTNGVRFHQETGLFTGDVANMFRAAQLRRHLRGRGANEAAALMDPAQHPDIAANINALGLSANHVERYLSNPDFHGEHRAGSVTRALFTSEHGQKLRNAMTDNSGIGIGRLHVNDNFNLVVARATARAVALTTRQRAQVTMRVHNQGAGNLDGYLSDLSATGNDQYVRQGHPALESMMCDRECVRGSWLGYALLAGLAVSALIGCDRTQARTETASGPRPPPQALHAADAGPARERSATRFERRPCEGEAAIPDEAERILTERQSDTREHCELHALGPDRARRLFVRTMNTVAHDDEGNRLPACIWEVFAVSPQPVRHLGSLYVCEFAVQNGCVYDLDQTLEPSVPTACIDADGRLAETGP